MEIPWTVHIPQALQQHGARRTWRDITERDRLADLKIQSAQPNRAEDEAGPPVGPARPTILRCARNHAADPDTAALAR